MSSPRLPQLSFGIEIEAILGFHQSKLEGHLSTHFPGATVVKALNLLQEKGLRHKNSTSPSYHSWALANAGHNMMTVAPTVKHETGPLRAYKDEPLNIVKEILSTTECARNIHVHNPEDQSKPTDYSRWILTSDHTLDSLQSSEQKVAACTSKVISTEAENWDSYGIELVSPPYTSITNAHDDISAIVSNINAPSTTFLTKNQSCGLHVHIGLPSGECLPIKALQHLAYMLIVYEDQISRLHPDHRRQRDTEILTNRENFYAECEDVVARTVVDHLTGELATKKFTLTYKNLAAVRHSLFAEVDASGNPLNSLQVRMGKYRGRIVNFAYLNRKGGSCTLEFRQHAGTTNAIDITHWVRFLLKLVELAFRYGKGEGECKVNHWDDKIDIEDLFAEMGLAEEAREFYRRKMRVYAVGAREGLLFWKEEEIWDGDEEEDKSDEPYFEEDELVGSDEEEEENSIVV